MTKEMIERLSETLVREIGAELRILRKYTPYRTSREQAIDYINNALSRCYGAFMFFLSFADESNLFSEEELHEMEDYWNTCRADFYALRDGV